MGVDNTNEQLRLVRRVREVRRGMIPFNNGTGSKTEGHERARSMQGGSEDRIQVGDTG